MLLASSPPDTSDFHYYFFMGNELKDSRDFQTVQLAFKPGKTRRFPSKNKILIYQDRYSSKRYLHLFRMDGTSIGSITLYSHEYLTPDWKHIIHSEKGDLWASDIDWNTARRSNTRQLTQLGVIRDIEGVINFYDRKILYEHCSNEGSGHYNIDIHTKEMVKLPKEMTIALLQTRHFFSSNHRYLISSGFNHLVLSYDFKRQKHLPIHAVSFTVRNGAYEFWLDPNTLVNLRDERINGQSGVHQFAEITHLETQITRRINFNLPPRYSDAYLPKAMQRFDPGKGCNQNVSPNHTHFLYYANGAPKQNVLSLRLVDIATQQETTIVNDCPNDKFLCQWVSNHHLIYTQKGDLMTQGTWIFDIRNESKKRISPYIADNVITLRKIDQVIFMANGEVFRCKSDGSELTTLGKVTGYRSNLKPFLP